MATRLDQPRPATAAAGEANRVTRAALFGLGVALIALTWWGITVNQLTQFYFVEFAVYLVAVGLLLRRSPAFADRAGLAWIVGVAVAIRLLFFFSTPSLSDDLYRYIWDGRLFNLGFNPYLYSADAPVLEPLRGPLWAGVADKWLYTVYPPVSELAFALIYRVFGETFKGMQFLGLITDLGVMGALWALLGTLGVARDRILIYGWSPLPALHYVHSGHHDPLLILGYVLAILFVARGAPVLSGIALTGSALAKLHTAILGPLFLRYWGWRGTLAAVIAAIALYLPFVGDGPAIFRGLTSEAGAVIFNDGGQYLIRWLVQRFVEDGRSIARYIAFVIVLGVGAYFFVRHDPRPAALWRRAYVLLALFLLVAPMVQPWYVGWLLPFLSLALRPGAGWFPFALTPGFGYLIWSGTVGLTDFSYGNDTPYLWWYLRAVQYLPIAALLAWWAIVHRPRGGWPGRDRVAAPASREVVHPPG